MAKKKAKKAKEIEFFKQVYKVLKSNVELREVSIEVIGTYSEKYDKKHRSDWVQFFNNLKNKKTISEKDVVRFSEMGQKHPHQSRLYKQNAIVSIVTLIDETFSAILKHYYYNHRSKLPLNEMCVSYKELDSFRTIDEIKNHLISNEVNAILLREGIKNRLKIFKTDLGLQIPEKTSHLEELNRLVKLRNLVVHNSCIADKEYANKFGDKKVRRERRLKLTKSI